MPDGPIILFDGDCALCSRAVRFVLARDGGGRFRFAPLQSKAAERLLTPAGLAPGSLGSVVLLNSGVALLKTDAALGILARLPRPWRWLAVLRIVPRPLRDRVYDVVARNRYRWFGRAASCPLPPPDLAARLVK